jgi:hypothetical protein
MPKADSQQICHSGIRQSFIEYMVVEWAQRQRSYMPQAMPSETPVTVVASATWAPGEGRAARRSVKAYCRLRAMRGTPLRATRGRHYAKSGADAWQCGGRALSFPAPVSFSSIPQMRGTSAACEGVERGRGVVWLEPTVTVEAQYNELCRGRLRDAVLRGVPVRTQGRSFQWTSSSACWAGPSRRHRRVGQA